MPHAPSSRPSSVLHALALSAVLAASGLSPHAVHAAAVSSASAAAVASCPYTPPPLPLRTLYQLSERIVVAKAGKSVGVAGEGREQMRRTTFAANESLKGDPGEKSLPVYHWFSTDDPTYPGNFREGETLLLFLRRAEAEEEYGYEVVDVQRGAKRLGEEALKVYLKRIDELGWLLRQEPPAPDELGEWLVRCIEEPATRWEGAAELVISQRLAAVEASAKQAAAGEKPREDETETADEAEDEEAEDVEAVAPDETSDVESGDAEEAGDSEGETEPATDGAEAEEVVTSETELVEAPEGFVEIDPAVERRMFRGTDISPAVFAQLTPEQKERIASALYGANEIDEGERQLVPLVEAWDDGRLAPFLVKQLAKLADDPPYEVEGLMQTVAGLLKDRRLRKLAEKYSEEAPYSDAIEEEEESGDGAPSAAKTSLPSAEPRPAAQQVRAAMLRAFLAAVEDRLNHLNWTTAQKQ